MNDVLPILCIPGLACSARLYASQIPPLWSIGPVTLAQHAGHDRLDAIAHAVLESAPPHFALIGLSMGGYIAFEILRQAPERVLKLALLDTSARPDTPEQTAYRRTLIDAAGRTPIGEVGESLFPRLVHRNRTGDLALRATIRLMAEETGAAGFVRQQLAVIGRADSRPTLGTIRCPTLVVVGDGDRVTPPEVAAEMANGIPGSRLVTLPECGHCSTLERPQQVTDALLELLRA